MQSKVILTCAVTGNAPLNPKYPYEYPVTPKQICATVVEAANAGASICWAVMCAWGLRIISI